MASCQVSRLHTRGRINAKAEPGYSWQEHASRNFVGSTWLGPTTCLHWILRSTETPSQRGRPSFSAFRSEAVLRYMAARSGSLSLCSVFLGPTAS